MGKSSLARIRKLVKSKKATVVRTGQDYAICVPSVRRRKARKLFGTFLKIGDSVIPESLADERYNLTIQVRSNWLNADRIRTLDKLVAPKEKADR
jgi:hypothetical protein